MCGIASIFVYKAGGTRVDAEELLRIRETMLSRGPDAGGLWISTDNTVGLAHRRLAIIDLSEKGAQPMVLEESGTRITFNGEIYNYKELRKLLEQRGRVFRSDSDTEVILHAYEVYGPSFVRHLRGMYAFAIWDERRKGMLLARDPFGIKPLYYSNDGRRIVVASQVKAVRAANGVSGDLDPAAKVSFLTLGSVVEPVTLYRSIRALPSGSTLWVDEKGVREPFQFWSVTDVFCDAEVQPESVLSAEELRFRLRELLLESVRYHMVADVPVGLFLSGGLDSTTMAALATEDGFDNLRTVTLGFDALRNTPYDEVGIAETVADTYRTTHNSEWIGVDKFAAERQRLLDAMDQPSIDGVNTYFVSKVANATGLKVALSGLGGDEMFAGYPSFRQVPRIAGFIAPFSVARWFGRSFRYVSAPLLKRFTSPKFSGLFEYGASIEDAYLLRRGLFMPWELPEVLDPDEAREGWQQLSLAERFRLSTRGLKQPRAKVAALEMAFFMRNQLLRDSDWAGMAHSLEIRLPLVDAHLLQQLAPHLVGKKPFGKQDMSATLFKPLPPAVLNRPKSGFSVPVREWLMQDPVTSAQHSERGLRGWAKFVIESQLGTGG